MEKQAKQQRQLSWNEIIRESTRKAIGGGVPGSAAMAIQVITLMWLRTTMNYQYRYGKGMFEAMRLLYKEGGIVRFYRGFVPAIVQAPLSRFGDCFANAGMLTLLSSFPITNKLPVGVKTASASVAAGLFRMLLMPVDCLKTIMQVEGKKGLPILRAKIKQNGVGVLFYGAFGSAGATAVGHFPWFFVYNYLNSKWENPKKFSHKVMRNATIGFAAGVVSDVCSNSVRILKTYRQTSAVKISYYQSLKNVYKLDGITGVLFRGLDSRIIAHGVNSIVFTVIWRILEEEWFKKVSKK